MSLVFTEEMPDYRETAPLPSDVTLRATAKDSIVEAATLKMKAFFDNPTEEASDTLAKLTSELQVERKANIYYGLAFDKSLQIGLGIETAMFAPKHKLKPLKLNEKRYKQNCESPVLGMQCRSCVVNSETGERRLEYPVETINGAIEEPTLYTSVDRCSMGRPLMDFLCLGLCLRHVHQYDIWHILEGFLKKSYLRVGKHFARLEATVTYRVFSGPFKFCSF